MEYKIVAGSSAKELEQQVNDLISEGWALVGGVSVAVLHTSMENERKGYTESVTDWEYVQAMTRQS